MQSKIISVVLSLAALSVASHIEARQESLSTLISQFKASTSTAYTAVPEFSAFQSGQADAIVDYIFLTAFATPSTTATATSEEVDTSAMLANLASITKVVHSLDDQFLATQTILPTAVKESMSADRASFYSLIAKATDQLPGADIDWVDPGSLDASPSPVPTGVPKGSCPVQWASGVVFLPDTVDCASYYVCNANGKPVKFTCSEGTYFDFTRLVCDYTANVKCT
ncbi:hypothetical protein BZA05DRAFT_473640 [Tricharina praecox]|uniref:uncharacterized protein n=1 Tax=Tricharina praecox TaxID=43433 RepID=UPI00221E706E|nr:uncharacterized protein BZA05DRAFT_473640 [Tricharina praecox]KAI5853602.1 hypothetical protein BZA05DRAFT_473640 [Tricharina praecox]